MKKKKILFITGEFIPYTQSVGGVIRVLSYLKSLKGHDLKLISIKKKKYGFYGFKKDIDHVKKIYIKSKINSKNNLKKYIFTFFKIFFSNLLYILGIDHNFFNNQKYLKEIDNIYLSFNPDYIIISAPPFSLFRLVSKIRKKDKNVKIILDYRDGWTQRIKSKRLFLIKKIMTKIEKNILDQCHYALCATKQIFNDILLLNKSKKTILLKNGFLYTPKKKIAVKKNKNISIGYFGLISDDNHSYRDIKVIYNSLHVKNNINFIFYGNSILKKKFIKNYQNFTFKKNISYFETQKKMKNFDYLLILHTEKSTSKEVITGKFYEYLSSGVPIIMISNGETEAGRLIKKYKLGFSIDYSKVSLKNFFLNLKKIKNKKLDNLKQFSREEQNKKLLKILK